MDYTDLEVFLLVVQYLRVNYTDGLITQIRFVCWAFSTFGLITPMDWLHRFGGFSSSSSAFGLITPMGRLHRFGGLFVSRLVPTGWLHRSEGLLVVYCLRVDFTDGLITQIRFVCWSSSSFGLITRMDRLHRFGVFSIGRILPSGWLHWWIIYTDLSICLLVV